MGNLDCVLQQEFLSTDTFVKNPLVTTAVVWGAVYPLGDSSFVFNDDIINVVNGRKLYPFNPSQPVVN